MLIQQWLVGLIVLACLAHASWALMPKAQRKRWASRLLGRDAAEAKAGGGACGGCEGCAGAAPPGSSKPMPPATRPLVFHPRRPR